MAKDAETPASGRRGYLAALVGRVALMLATCLAVVAIRSIGVVQDAGTSGWLTSQSKSCVLSEADCASVAWFVWLGAALPIAIALLLALGVMLSPSRDNLGLPRAHTWMVLVALGITAGVFFRAAPSSSRWPTAAGLVIASMFVVTFGRAAWLRIDRYLTSTSRKLSTRLLLNAIVVAIYAAFILLIPQVGGQALDALRSWSLTDLGNGATKTMLGLSSTCLFGLSLREILSSNPPVDRTVGPFHPWRWISIGAAALCAGIVVVALELAGPGLGILGALVLVLGAIGKPRVRDLRPLFRRGSAEPDTPIDQEQSATHPMPTTQATSPTAPGQSSRTETLTTGEQLVVAGPFVVVGAALLLVAADNSWTATSLGPAVGPGATAMGLVLVGALVAGPFRARADETPTPRVGSANLRWLPVLLIAVPLLTIKLSRPEVTFGLTVLLVVLPFFAYLVCRIRGRTSMRTLSSAFCCWSALALAVAVHVDPLRTGTVVGVMTMVNVFSAVTAWAGYGLNKLSLAEQPPPVLAKRGMRRVPLVPLIVVWILIAGFVPHGSMHAVPIHKRVAGEAVDGSLPSAPDLSTVFQKWVDAQPELERSEGPGGARPVPLVLVSAHGGGIRAAYWTALVLDCLVGRSRSRRLSPEGACDTRRRSVPEIRTAAGRLMLASGVSGGSVGLAAYAQHMRYGDDIRSDRWIKDTLGKDYASPTIGWGLFHDLPNGLFGLPADRNCLKDGSSTCFRQDRAAPLSATVDAGDPNPPLRLRKVWDERESSDLAVRESAESVPLLVFNSVLTGGRFGVLTSAAKLGTQSLNLKESPYARATSTTARDPYPLTGYQETIDLLCDSEDISVSTAAVLSARFPFISPSGEVRKTCDRTGKLGNLTFDDCKKSNCSLSMVDGGYLDNSGMLAIAGLLPELRRLILDYNASEAHPVKIALTMVDIDSAYQGDAPYLVDSGAYGESVVPLRTAITRSAVEAYTRGRIFRSLAGCVWTIAPPVHPGIMAPLGWSLSDSTMDELDSAVDDATRPGIGKASGRVTNLRRLQGWLGADESPPDQRQWLRTCVPTPRSSLSIERAFPQGEDLGNEYRSTERGQNPSMFQRTPRSARQR